MEQPVADHRWSMTLEWDVQQLTRLQVALESTAQACGWGPALLSQMQLVAEELVVNVMTHGHEGRDADADPGWLRFDLSQQPGLLQMTVTDNGVPYDPTAQAASDVQSPLEARERGGLGVHLVRQLCDELQYTFDRGCNVIRVVKRMGVDG